MKKTLLPTILSLLIFLMATSPAHAQVALTVSPPRVEAQLAPGETLQQALKITNDTSTPVTLKLLIQDFIVQDDQGTPVKVSPQEAGRYVASPWFIVDKPTLTLQPQQTQVVTVLIKTPPDALPGGHYAGIYFEPQLGSKPTTTGAKVVPQIGSLFVLTVKGDIHYDALITNFTPSQRFFEFGPVHFSASLKNLSDTHISTLPTITIKDMLGRTLTTLNLDRTNVFPYTSRHLTTTWEQVWGLGKYSATLTIPYGSGKVTSATTYFWIVPYRLIVAIIIALLALIAITISVRRHLQHRRDTTKQELETLKRRLAELENDRLNNS